MKKIFMAAAAMLTITTTIFGNSDMDHSARKERRMERKEARKEHRLVRKAEDRNLVSDLTRAQFRRDFPDVTKVKFERTKDFDQVSFMSNGKELMAYYDFESNLIGTTEHKSFGELPQGVQKRILDEYPDYTIQDVVLFDDNESNDADMVMYGTVFDDADNYFIELKKDNKAIVLKADMAGEVSYFTTMK